MASKTEENREEEEEAEDPVDDALWFARTGELDELKEAIQKAGSQEICVDAATGSSLLHMACANGHVACVQYLLNDLNADQGVLNKSGSTPLHWAVQNNQLDVCKVLCARPEANVLLRNGQGKSSTSLALEKGNGDLIKLLLEHSSAAELEAREPEEEDLPEEEQQIKKSENADVSKSPTKKADDTADLQYHDSTFFYIKSDEEPTPGITIREVGYIPKTLEELAEGDASRTHYTVWAASVILARWVCRDQRLQGKNVLELGCGCGLPGLAVYRCCKPSKVLLTDLIIKDHLVANARAVRKKIAKTAKAGQKSPPLLDCAAIDWRDAASLPPSWIGNTDVLLGSDLVYDKALVGPLVDICGKLSRPKVGMMFYVSAKTDRAGLNDFAKAMKQYFVLESTETAPISYLKNPLGDDKLDLFELHLSELRDVEHVMYRFRRRDVL